MTLKKFFNPEKLSKLTKNLHTKAQSFFELKQTPPTPRTTNFASIPPKQLALFLQQAIRSQKTATLTLALKDGTTETLSGKLVPIKNRFDAVTLKVSDKQIRVVFIKDIVHLGLERFSVKDVTIHHPALISK